MKDGCIPVPSTVCSTICATCLALMRPMKLYSINNVGEPHMHCNHRLYVQLSLLTWPLPRRASSGSATNTHNPESTYSMR